MLSMRALSGRIVDRVRQVLARPNPEAAFFLGNQKSGTTAIAALTAKLTGATSTIDLMNANREAVWPRIWSGEMSFDALVASNRLDFSRQIVKEPSLSPFVAHLLDHFPRSRGIVAIVRDPRDNIRSILDRHKLPGDLEDLPAGSVAAMPGGWSTVFDSRWLGGPPGSYIVQLAYRWQFIASRFRQYGARIHIVRYEDFLRDKPGFLTTLAGRLGLTSLHDVRGEVDRQYQPAGTPKRDWGEYFGATNLGIINDICADQMRPLDYDPLTRAPTWTRLG
jgi:hypothetical protein